MELKHQTPRGLRRSLFRFGLGVGRAMIAATTAVMLFPVTPALAAVSPTTVPFGGNWSFPSISFDTLVEVDPVLIVILLGAGLVILVGVGGAMLLARKPRR